MSFISKALDNIKRFVKGKSTKNKFDFLDEMEDAYPNDANKSTGALKYLRKVLKDKTYSENPNGIKGGNLYWFNYKEPLTKETLPYWDAEPLVIMSSTFKNQNGQPRVLGLNLHLLPPKTRIAVFNEVYNMHKNSFDKKLGGQEYNFEFEWKQMYSAISQFGGEFALRMYAPSQITKLKKFPIEEWALAAYIPSRRYVGTNLKELESEWKKFMANRKR